MDLKQIMSFVKIEHTLFSLPFILAGYIVANNQFNELLDDKSVFSLIYMDIVLAWCTRISNDAQPNYR